MRGKISDQDLTDYALNELPPEERLYVESMFAVSEECRHDVYEMIELTQLMEEGFERESSKVPTLLTQEQREKLLYMPSGPSVWQKTAAVVGLAACTALAITQPGLWNVRQHAGTVANVSTKVSTMVTNAVSTQKIEFSSPFPSLRSLAVMPSTWLPAEVSYEKSMICTPPSWLEASQLTAFGDVNQYQY